MKLFFTRTLSGLIYVILIVGSILLGKFYFSFLLFVFLILSLKEFKDLLWGKENITWLFIYYTINLVFFIIVQFYGFKWISAQVFFISMGMLGIIFSALTFLNRTSIKQNISGLLLGLVYIALPLALGQYLFDFQAGESSFHLLLGLFIILWINDSLAYVTGSLFGKHKLAPGISPKKTWEGAIGGLLFSLVGTYGMSFFLSDINLSDWLSIAGIVIILGTFGDLFESYLKRKAGIKESGNIMPGHGGILDRIDSLLFALPAVFIYIQLV
ncbi:MAG: phosphatidate cytidylyltransferase [Bacteroidales bacterium]|nr:phosphatidate cytidylyltransferase [Bacteroidales bacterium]MCF8403629.1 phosphatidate cytidylyltransferase [Bacteroidales bacterium]